MTLRHHTDAELQRLRDANWRDQQSLLHRPKSSAVTRTIKALQARMVEIIIVMTARNCSARSAGGNRVLMAGAR